jgi:hypothetical protein
MGIFARWRSTGFALYAQELWEDGTEEAVRGYREEAERQAREDLRNARSEWLETNRAERSFPCGIVPDLEPGPGETRRPEVRLNVLRSRPLQVIAAVLPHHVAFLREERDPSQIVEVGRIPRAAIQAVEVVDEHGNEVPQPLEESFEPSKLAIVELRWLNEGVPTKTGSRSVRRGSRGRRPGSSRPRREASPWRERRAGGGSGRDPRVRDRGDGS